MTLTIPDDILKKIGINEMVLRVEVACSLFDRGVLALWPAAQLAEMSRVEFEGELSKRRIPIYRPTVEDVRMEVKALEELGI